jgi:hypothetical protein
MFLFFLLLRLFFYLKMQKTLYRNHLALALLQFYSQLNLLQYLRNVGSNPFYNTEE